MNDFNNRFEDRRARWEERMQRNHGNGHIWTGVLLLIIGGLALIKSFGVPVPGWLFSWQMLLIGIGLFIGIRKGFSEGGWFIPVLIGAAFLVNDYFLNGQLHKHIWPLVLVILGIFFIVRSSRKPYRQGWQKKNAGDQPETIALEANESYSDSDFINTTCIFGGTKKVILSKNFRGGDITTVFGGAEIDLTQADFNENAVFEITAIFGGATLLIPSHWELKSTVTTVFGGIDDKRKVALLTNSSGKTLLLKGTVIFGGIEIKSY